MYTEVKNYNRRRIRGLNNINQEHLSKSYNYYLMNIDKKKKTEHIENDETNCFVRSVNSMKLMHRFVRELVNILLIQYILLDAHCIEPS